MPEQTQKIITLRIAEASQRDFGRGIARIDPEDMERIGVETGDIIQITGKSYRLRRQATAEKG